MEILGSSHPLENECDVIHGAMLLGLAERDDIIPENLALNFEDAFASGVGISTLRIADWASKTQAVLYSPVAVPDDDPTWLVGCEEGFERVKHRIFIRDILSRGFHLRFGNTEDLTPYLQFDVISEGIVLSAKPGEQTITSYGEFESETYDVFIASARLRASIAELATLAAVL